MQSSKTSNQTNKNDESNRGILDKKGLENEIFTAWQGHVEY